MCKVYTDFSFMFVDFLTGAEKVILVKKCSLELLIWGVLDEGSRIVYFSINTCIVSFIRTLG